MVECENGVGLRHICVGKLFVGGSVKVWGSRRGRGYSTNSTKNGVRAHRPLEIE